MDPMLAARFGWGDLSSTSPCPSDFTIYGERPAPVLVPATDHFGVPGAVLSPSTRPNLRPTSAACGAVPSGRPASTSAAASVTGGPRCDGNGAACRPSTAAAGSGTSVPPRRSNRRPPRGKALETGGRERSARQRQRQWQRVESRRHTLLAVGSSTPQTQRQASPSDAVVRHHHRLGTKCQVVTLEPPEELGRGHAGGLARRSTTGAVVAALPTRRASMVSTAPVSRSPGLTVAPAESAHSGGSGTAPHKPLRRRQRHSRRRVSAPEHVSLAVHVEAVGLGPGSGAVPLRAALGLRASPTPAQSDNLTVTKGTGMPASRRFRLGANHRPLTASPTASLPAAAQAPPTVLTPQGDDTACGERVGTSPPPPQPTAVSPPAVGAAVDTSGDGASSEGDDNNADDASRQAPGVEPSSAGRVARPLLMELTAHGPLQGGADLPLPLPTRPQAAANFIRGLGGPMPTTGLPTVQAVGVASDKRRGRLARAPLAAPAPTPAPAAGDDDSREALQSLLTASASYPLQFSRHSSGTSSGSPEPPRDTGEQQAAAPRSECSGGDTPPCANGCDGDVADTAAQGAGAAVADPFVPPDTATSSGTHSDAPDLLLGTQDLLLASQKRVCAPDSADRVLHLGTLPPSMFPPPAAGSAATTTDVTAAAAASATNDPFGVVSAAGAGGWDVAPPSPIVSPTFGSWGESTLRGGRAASEVDLRSMAKDALQQGGSSGSSRATSATGRRRRGKPRRRTARRGAGPEQGAGSAAGTAKHDE